MAETVQEGDLIWIEGTFKSVSYIDHEQNTIHKVKVKVDRAFLVPPDWLESNVLSEMARRYGEEIRGAN